MMPFARFSSAVCLGCVLFLSIESLNTGTVAAQVATADARTLMRVEKNVAYFPESAKKDSYQSERCFLDVYLPSAATDFPLVVWFHGGGLRGGVKDGDMERAIAQRFVASGIGFVSVNYRLSPKANFPAYVEDAAAAVAYAYQHAGDWGASDEKVFVSGHSAGGYLTLMVALDPKYLKSHGLKPTQLAGYFPVSGQTITHSTVRAERGLPEDRPVIDEAAPSFHAKTNTAPIFCIAGDNDLAGRSEENRYLVALLRDAKATADFQEFADRDHGTIASKIPEEGDPVFAAIQTFINQVEK